MDLGYDFVGHKLWGAKVNIELEDCKFFLAALIYGVLLFIIVQQF